MDEYLLGCSDKFIEFLYHKARIKKISAVCMVLFIYASFCLILSFSNSIIYLLVTAFVAVVCKMKDLFYMRINLKLRNLLIAQRRMFWFTKLVRIFLVLLLIVDIVLDFLAGSNEKTFIPMAIYAIAFYLDDALYPKEPPPKRKKEVYKIREVWA